VVVNGELHHVNFTIGRIIHLEVAIGRIRHSTAHHVFILAMTFRERGKLVLLSPVLGRVEADHP
jgi:hypothetical protein